MSRLAENFLETYLKRKAAEELVKQLTRQESYLEALLIEELAYSTTTRTTLLGQNLGIRSEYRPQLADGKTKEEAAAALKKVDPSLVKEDFNLNSLGAVMRGWRDEGKPVPAELVGVIEPYEILKISVTKASK